MPYTFAIIGGGLTAASTLCRLVEQLTKMGDKGRVLSRNLSVLVFEKASLFAPGLPHNERIVLPFHITNMCAEDMSVRCNHPDDFAEWVKKHPQKLHHILRNGALPAAADFRQSSCHHYPRAVMGAYLETRFADAVEAAGNLGIAVKLHAESEVIDLEKENEKIRLVISGASGTSAMTYVADGALLATGHWFGAAGKRNYLPSPWPASELLDAIPKGKRVAVIGSSLSAIEVVLTLTSDGRFLRQPSGDLVYRPPENPRKIILHSRTGHLPKVRGRVGRRPNRHLKCSCLRELIERHPGRLTLSPIYELLDRELADAYGIPLNWQDIVSPKNEAMETLRQDIQRARQGDGPEGELIWQTVLTEIFPMVRDLYLNLTLNERVRFDRHFNTLFFTHVATQPLINGEKLLALMQADIVSLVRLGNDYHFECNGDGGLFEFLYTGPRGKRLRDTFQYVIDARGQPRSVESDPSRLMHNLLKKGFIQIEESGSDDDPYQFPAIKTGSVVVNPENHRIVRPGTQGDVWTDPQLYAVGAMTRGQMIDASMAYGINRSTAGVIEDLIDLLKNHHDSY